MFRVLTAIMALFVFALPLTAASDYFLKIEGVDGESEDAAHRNEIEVLSWSWGVSNSASMSSGQSTGRRTYEPIVFKKRIDKSSPLLFKSCATGKHIPKATLTVRRQSPTGGPEDYYTITLEDCFVTSYQTNGGGGSGGTTSEQSEEIKITFKKITISHLPSKSTESDVWSPRSN
jgi:type VI secretion system secreted protein Hcp